MLDFTIFADHFNEENFYYYFNDFFDCDEYDENCVSDTLVYSSFKQWIAYCIPRTMTDLYLSFVVILRSLSKLLFSFVLYLT